MTKEELAKKIYQISNLKGNFVLRSGQTSNEYFDKYLFEGQPEILASIAELMKTLIPKQFDFLAGLEMGGIPIATALSLSTGKPTLFIRKRAKEYGTCKFAEGGGIEGKRLLIVEDVVTSGGAIIDATRKLRSEGAIIEDVICVIDRQESGKQNLENAGLNFFPLFTKNFIESQVG